MTLLRSIGREHNAVVNEIHERHGKHWYLSNLVVAKAFQGKGVGSIMLDWGLRRADEDALPVFCLSSDEVSLMHIYMCGGRQRSEVDFRARAMNCIRDEDSRWSGGVNLLRRRGRR